MSRAYRIKVQESARQVLRASDHVSTHLELLGLLPPERMADLLAAELERRGFKKAGTKLVRRTPQGIVVEVDSATCTVTVKAEQQQEVMLQTERQGWTNVERGQQIERDRDNLRKEAHKDLQHQAQEKAAELQKKVTDQLEGHLADLRKELDQAVNRVTAEALKEKAAQLGQIKELSEDVERGELTIVLEV